MSYYNKYQKVDVTAKRHIVIGDIHAQYQLLIQLLDKLDYNPSSDMLYTVGDMIDRGPNSFEVVDFFTRHERRMSTLGNHEAMALASSTMRWYSNGGAETAQSYSNMGVSLLELEEAVRELPLVLDITDGDLTFRIVHAELPSRLEEDLIQLKLGSMYKDNYFDESCIWGRTDISSLRHTDKDRLSELITKNQPVRTLVGHSIVDEPLTLGTRTYLNVPMGQLCAIDVVTNKFYTVSEK